MYVCIYIYTYIYIYGSARKPFTPALCKKYSIKSSRPTANQVSFDAATSHVLMHLLPGAKSRPIQNFLTPWLGLWGIFSQGPHCLNHRGDPQLASRKSPIHPGCVAPTEACLGNRCSTLICPEIAIIPL